MDAKVARRIHGVAALVTFAAVVFYLFFQINKSGPFRDMNPFGDDPYDAVGSMAIQVALLIGVLTYARALRLREMPSDASKTRLILRGNIIVLSAIVITLIADAIAEVVRPFPPSDWGRVLLAELLAMFGLAFLCVIAVAVVFRRIRTGAPPAGLTVADALDDLWTLVRLPVTKASAVLPSAFVGWVQRFHSDLLFVHFEWVNPRRHPWRFACALGLLVGVVVFLAQLQEGLPPNLKIGLLVAGIFILVEFIATLAGYAALGRYLGLRPSA